MTSLKANIKGFISILAPNRAALVDYCLSRGKTGVDGRPSVEVRGAMPCGSTVQYAIEDLPDASVPCPCGDETHWLVKYLHDTVDSNVEATNLPLGITDYLKALDGTEGKKEEVELTPAQQGALTRKRNRKAAAGGSS